MFAFITSIINPDFAYDEREYSEYPEEFKRIYKHLEEKDLLDDTVIVLYGDHDCKLKQSEFRKLYDSEYYQSVLIDPEDTVGTIDNFTYEI